MNYLAYFLLLLLSYSATILNLNIITIDIVIYNMIQQSAERIYKEQVIWPKITLIRDRIKCNFYSYPNSEINPYDKNALVMTMLTDILKYEKVRMGAECFNEISADIITAFKRPAFNLEEIMRNCSCLEDILKMLITNIDKVFEDLNTHCNNNFILEVINSALPYFGTANMKYTYDDLQPYNEKRLCNLNHKDFSETIPNFNISIEWFQDSNQLLYEIRAFLIKNMDNEHFNESYIIIHIDPVILLYIYIHDELKNIEINTQDPIGIATYKLITKILNTIDSLNTADVDVIAEINNIIKKSKIRILLLKNINNIPYLQQLIFFLIFSRLNPEEDKLEELKKMFIGLYISIRQILIKIFDVTIKSDIISS